MERCGITRRGGLLFGPIGILLVGLLSWPGGAAAQKRAPQEPALDRVVRAIQEMWTGVEINVVRGAGACRLSAAAVSVAVRPFDRQSSGVTEGQKKNLLIQITANIRRLARGGLKDYDVLRNGRNLSDAEMLREVHFIITPVVRKVATATGWGYRFLLYAEHSRSECGWSGSEVLLEEDDVGEPVYPPDTMFDAIARKLLEQQETGDVRVLLRQPRFDDREASDEQWDTLVLALQKSLQTARDDPAVVTTRLPRVSADRAPRDLQGNVSDAWIADVTLHPERASKLRTEIRLGHPRYRMVGDIVYADPAPFTVRALALTRQGAVPGAAPPLLSFTDRPQFVRDTLRAGLPPQRLGVEVASQAVLELDLKALAGSPVGLALTSEDGQPIPAAETLASRPGLARYMLRRGRYVLRLLPPSAGTTDFLLRVRGTAGTLSGEPNGTVLQTAGDWVVGTHEGPGGRECFAATAPVELSPEVGWRPAGPLFQFRVAHAGAVPPPLDDPLTMVHLFDAARFYDPARRLQAVLVLPNGQAQSLPVGRDPEGRICGLGMCNDAGGGGASDPTSLWKLAGGRQLIVAGVAPDGRATRVVYSLRGYTAAINALSVLCNDPRVADRVVPAADPPRPSRRR